jgi:hypothetical protein
MYRVVHTEFRLLASKLGALQWAMKPPLQVQRRKYALCSSWEKILFEGLYVKRSRCKDYLTLSMTLAQIGESNGGVN